MNFARRAWFLFALIIALMAPAVATAAESDAVIQTGLQACNVNDLRTCIRTWYAHDPVQADKLQLQLDNATKGLGDILSTEIVATRDLGKRVRRYYIALYFSKHPFWLRVDRYNTNGIVQITLPLKFSLVAGEILPREVTGE